MDYEFWFWIVIAYLCGMSEDGITLNLGPGRIILPVDCAFGDGTPTLEPKLTEIAAVVSGQFKVARALAW